MQMTQGIRQYLLMLVATGLLAGCAKGIDLPLVTGKDDKAFRESLAAASKGMSDREKEASAWINRDIESLEDFHARYPNATLRQAIRLEVKSVLDTYPKIVAALEPRKAASDAMLLELTKIVVNEASFSLERDFFGLQPTIKTKLINGSSLPVSSLKWNALLFMESRAEPIATAQLFDSYNESLRGTNVSQGLVPGKSVARQFKVGLLGGDAAWTTIEIQNAKHLRVQLAAIPDSVRNLADKKYWDLQQHNKLTSELESKKDAIQAAKKYSDI